MSHIILRLLFVTMISVSFNAFSGHYNSSVFYPLPIQTQGNFLAAKSLYLGSGGGLWVHDVHGKVLFYDGHSLLPRKGSLLDFSAEKVAFLNDEFWTFSDNEVYRHKPSQGTTLAFSLRPGAEISNIGASEEYIWITDGANFYTYNVRTLEFSTYSLLKLYQYNNSSDIKINDAERVLSKWVVATSSGVYLSGNKTFSHIAASGKKYVETVYFSNTRRELVIGTLNGAVVVDITQQGLPPTLIPGSHVLSIAETSEEYWVGTEHGLLSYNFFDSTVSRTERSSTQDFALPGEKIYSLVNDTAGGMWVATNNGIRYFSLYSNIFKRISLFGVGAHYGSIVINQVLPQSATQYWVATSVGLFFVDINKESGPEQVYYHAVSALVMVEEQLLLATSGGVMSINPHNLMLNKPNLPRKIRDLSFEQITLSHDRQLWMISGQDLYAYDLDTKKVVTYGSDWVVEKFLPTKLTDVVVGQQGEVYIGTDHGFYSMVDKAVRYNKASERFGKTVDITEAADGSYWFANSYGVFRLPYVGGDIEEVSLVEDNIIPSCLLSDSNGMWLGSSKGLSYYDLNGRLNKHIGSPFGLITNELTSNACSSIYSEKAQSPILIFGSNYGLVSGLSDEILVSRTPSRRVLLSQISVDNQVVTIGGQSAPLDDIPYGASIRIKLGMLPTTDAPLMEYRLKEAEDWTEFEGGLLTLEHLLPGKYTLEIRPIHGSLSHFISTTQSFTIAEPWYLTNWAAISILVSTILVITGLVLWRSRYVTFANKELRAQVALKTDQLRHQSRILITTNQQLKKQLAVRDALVSHTANELTGEVNRLAMALPSWNEEPNESPIVTLRNGLVQLNSTQQQSCETSCYDIVLVLESVLKAWKEELMKAKIHLNVNLVSKHRHISLSYFNLDIIFNSLIANVIKRNFNSQSLTILVEESDNQLVVTLRDCGTPFPKMSKVIGNAAISTAKDLNIEKLPLLVSQSGGELRVFVYEEQNKVQLSWPIDYQAVQELIDNTIEEIKTIELEQGKEHAITLSPEQEWTNKVTRLINEHYSDAEFGTTIAAKKLFMSERSLQRRFKSAYQRTFKDYLNEVRLEYACSQLLAGEKVSEVAFNCGFNDPSYFSQRFKHHFGVSPSKFVESSEE